MSTRALTAERPQRGEGGVPVCERNFTGDILEIRSSDPECLSE